MLDTPGILYPYLRNEESKLALTAISALEKGAPPVDDVVRWLISRIQAREELFHRFSRFYLKETRAGESIETLLQQIGEARSCLGPGGLVDLHKTSNLIINDFRKGTLGRISLEEPEDVESGVSSQESE